MAKRSSEDARTFLISVAAELAGMHAQTLRTYDRLGLVSPERTSGGGRRYSQHDVDLLREVQRLSQDEGVNLAGIKRIIELTNQVDALADPDQGDGARDRRVAGAAVQVHEHGAGGLAAWSRPAATSGRVTSLRLTDRDREARGLRLTGRRTAVTAAAQ